MDLFSHGTFNGYQALTDWEMGTQTWKDKMFPVAQSLVEKLISPRTELEERMVGPPNRWRGALTGSGKAREKQPLQTFAFCCTLIFSEMVFDIPYNQIILFYLQLPWCIKEILVRSWKLRVPPSWVSCGIALSPTVVVFCFCGGFFQVRFTF